MNKYDFLIIGGGIVGLTIARELQNRNPNSKIAVLEKEGKLGEHASARNSGVLHSGIYYEEDTLKARFCRKGNAKWKEYCAEHDLDIDDCGKFIVAKDENDLFGIEILNRRASANSIEVELLDPADAKELEPKIRTKFPSLFIKSTSVVDPMELVNSVSRDFIDSGGEIHFGIKYDKIEGGRILIAGGQRYHFGHLVNCAGLYSDKVASDFGFGNEYIMMPFKGVYLYLPPDFSGIKTHIYPVPDLKNPFLGVHLTRTLNGNVKIGPTAMPSFWREHYQGVDNFQLDEFKETISQLVAMFIQNKNGFRDLAIKESLHQSKKFLLEEAGRLVRNIPAVKSMKFGRPGIRAQLVQKSSHKLVMDFVIEGDRNSTHILNAVSPALTSAWPFAEYVVDKIESGLTDK